MQAKPSVVFSVDVEGGMDGELSQNYKFFFSLHFPKLSFTQSRCTDQSYGPVRGNWQVRELQPSGIMLPMLPRKPLIGKIRSCHNRCLQKKR